MTSLDVDEGWLILEIHIIGLFSNLTVSKLYWLRQTATIFTEDFNLSRHCIHSPDTPSDWLLIYFTMLLLWLYLIWLPMIISPCIVSLATGLAPVMLDQVRLLRSAGNRHAAQQTARNPNREHTTSIEPYSVQVRHAQTRSPSWLAATPCGRC